ncbi:MAG: hypothetical protein HKN32_02770 [Flavobacteriales bacterium]|nr:hypothetical protein [Flavobacteriales bacterium]
MRCVFYNVENLFDTKDNPRTRDDDFTADGAYEWNERRYFEKLDNIAEVIIEVGDEDPPDLIGLVEVENYHVVKDLTDHRELTHMPYKIIHAQSRDQRGIDVSLIYNSAAFEPENHKWLNIDKHAPSALFSRDILQVEGRTAQGERIYVFVCHWPSRRAGEAETAYKRKAAALTLREALDTIRSQDPRAKILVMGDFNDTPENKSLKTIVHAGRVSKGAGEIVNLAWDHHDADRGTVFRDGWIMFDQILASHDLMKYIKGKKMHVFDDDFILYFGKSNIPRPNRTYVGRRYAGGFSDHLPIWVDIKFDEHD